MERAEYRSGRVQNISKEGDFGCCIVSGLEGSKVGKMLKRNHTSGPGIKI